MKKHFFPIMCTLMLSALFLVTVGCSGNSNDQAGKQEQGLHLLSLKVKVIEMVEDEDNLFLVEALESYKDEINQGDTISVPVLRRSTAGCASCTIPSGATPAAKAASAPFDGKTIF